MGRFVFSIVLVFALALGLRPAAAGYSRGGGFSAPGYGARAWGMAGAAVAWGRDESAVFWNPALLARLDRNRLGLSYINLVPGNEAQQSYAAYAHVLRFGEVDEAGLEFNTHTVGVLYGNLALELSDGQSYNENTLRVAYAFSPLYFASVGAAFNLLLSSSDIAEFGSNGTSVDVGFRVELLEHVTMGAVIRNAFSSLEFDDGATESLPRSVTIGLARRFLGDRLLVEGDATGAFGGLSKYAVGAEYVPFPDRLYVRGGVSVMTSGETRAVPHIGIGVGLNRLRLDYNANLDTDEALSDTHRFALGIGL